MGQREILTVHAISVLSVPKLNQLTNHIPPVLNACFFMPDFALQVNVTEDNRILRDVVSSINSDITTTSVIDGLVFSDPD